MQSKSPLPTVLSHVELAGLKDERIELDSELGKLHTILSDLINVGRTTTTNGHSRTLATSHINAGNSNSDSPSAPARCIEIMRRDEMPDPLVRLHAVLQKCMTDGSCVNVDSAKMVNVERYLECLAMLQDWVNVMYDEQMYLFDYMTKTYNICAKCLREWDRLAAVVDIDTGDRDADGNLYDTVLSSEEDPGSHSANLLKEDTIVSALPTPTAESNVHFLPRVLSTKLGPSTVIPCRECICLCATTKTAVPPPSCLYCEHCHTVPEFGLITSSCLKTHGGC